MSDPFILCFLEIFMNISCYANFDRGMGGDCLNCGIVMLSSVTTFKINTFSGNFLKDQLLW